MERLFFSQHTLWVKESRHSHWRGVYFTSQITFTPIAEAIRSLHLSNVALRWNVLLKTNKWKFNLPPPILYKQTKFVKFVRKWVEHRIFIVFLIQRNQLWSWIYRIGQKSGSIQIFFMALLRILKFVTIAQNYIKMDFYVDFFKTYFF